MASTLSVILMDVVQKTMKAQHNFSSAITLPMTTRSPHSSGNISNGLRTTWTPASVRKEDKVDISRNIDILFNNTGLMNTDVAVPNSSNVTNPAHHDVSYWALVLLFIPACTLFGNLLVIISVVKCKSLHSPINYFILGLAIADMCVALAVMPFAVYVEFNDTWELSTVLCDLYCAADVTCSTASIFLLTCISFDRYVAATQPIRYANSAKGIGRVAIINVAVWLVSMLIASPMVLGLNNVPNRDAEKCMFYNADFIIYSSTGSFCIPLVIIMYLYGRIYSVIRQRSRFAQQRRHILTAAGKISAGGNQERSLLSNGLASGQRQSVHGEDAKCATACESEKLLNAIDYRRRSRSADRSSCVKPDEQLSAGRKSESKKTVSAAHSTSSTSTVSDPKNSTSSTTSSSSSVSASDSSEDCDLRKYNPQLDLMRHLQMTGNAMVDRHCQTPPCSVQRKNKSFFFSSSFLKGAVSDSNEKKRTSWHKGDEATDARESMVTTASVSSTGRHTVADPTLATSKLIPVPGPVVRAQSSRVHQERPPHEKQLVGTTVSLGANIKNNRLSASDRSLRVDPACKPMYTEASSNIDRDLLMPTDTGRPEEYRRRGKFALLKRDQRSSQSVGALAFINEQDFVDEREFVSNFERELEDNVSSSTFFNCDSPMQRNYETFKSEDTFDTRSEQRNCSQMMSSTEDGLHLCQIVENLPVTKIELVDEIRANGDLRHADKVDESDGDVDSNQNLNLCRSKSADAQNENYFSKDTPSEDNCTGSLSESCIREEAAQHQQQGHRMSMRLVLWRQKHKQTRVNGTANAIGDHARSSNAVQPQLCKTAQAVPGQTLAQPRTRQSKPKALKKVTKSQRKEKKATKTLAVVLGIFLICWLPFFTCNLLNAVCLKLHLACTVDFVPFFLTTWLGYTNSLMNPLIYTIFNMDFRRAFKQILCSGFARQRTRRV